MLTNTKATLLYTLLNFRQFISGKRLKRIESIWRKKSKFVTVQIIYLKPDIYAKEDSQALKA